VPAVRKLGLWATSLGARVSTTVSAEAKAKMSRRAGAVDVLGYPDDPATFGAKIRALTGGSGVAAVYDGVGRSNEFTWRTDELFAAVQAGTIIITTGDRYPLRDVAQAPTALIPASLPTASRRRAAS
jgi:NADPH:quinone reductase